MKDSRSRKWQLTINNPEKHFYTHEVIKGLLKSLKSLEYWCLCDEIGEKNTYHTHVYIYSSNAIRFSTIKNKFKIAHIELGKGTSVQNRDYIRKEGKWEKSKKKETNLIDTFEEFGECPIEMQGHRTDLENLYDLIKQGLSNAEIIELCPQFIFRIDKIESVRQMLKKEKYKKVFRKLDVTYIFGSTGTGKTRGVMEEYGYENVYRITDYEHPFDGYEGQDIIIFEEFRSSLRIQDMLNYLDGYPLVLPCRYSNKIACFTKIYIITNVDLKAQYENIQNESEETWKAFLRRIHRIKKYTSTGEVEMYVDVYNYIFNYYCQVK